MKIFLLAAVVVAILLIPHNAFAWDFGPWFGGFYHWGFDNYGQLGSGYYAGQQDAIHDHDQGVTTPPASF